MDSKENKPNLSRKELLAEYRLSKLKKDDNQESKTNIKAKVNQAARSTIATQAGKVTFKPKNTPMVSAKNLDSTKVLPSKLSQQRRVAKTDKSQLSNQEVIFVATVFEKLQEAELLAKNSDISVVRSFMQGIPLIPDIGHVTSKAIYWLTWIKLESAAHEWDKVESLFTNANSMVEDICDRSAIAAAYESYKTQANLILAAKFEEVSRLDDSSQDMSVHSTSDECDNLKDCSLLGNLLGYADHDDDSDQGGMWHSSCKYHSLLILHLQEKNWTHTLAAHNS
jgi:hypothetical protein